MRWPTVAPILFKEFAIRMRGSRGALLISLYVGLTTIAARLLYGVVAEQLDHGSPLVSAQIGQVIFIGLSLGLQALTVFLAPATALNAISSEYERGTIELLLSTPVSVFQFVIGKLVAACAFLLVLIVAALPVFAMVTLFGGVTLADMLRVGAMLLITALTGCVFGLFCSALTRQTYSATLLCYALLVCLVGGTLFAANVWSLANSMGTAPPTFVVANPLSAMAATLISVQPPAISLTGGLRPLVLLNLLTRGVTDLGSRVAPVPLHRTTAVIYGALAISLFWATVHLAAPHRRWRLTRLDAILLVLLLGYFALVYWSRSWWLLGLRFNA
ncbi:MAG: ABC transporter permease subunit [Chloroflexales bacterium]